MVNINPHKHPSYYRVSQGQLVKASVFYRAKTRWSKKHLAAVAEVLKKQSDHLDNPDPSSNEYLSAHRYNHLDRSLKFFQALEDLPFVEGVPHLHPDTAKITKKAMEHIPKNQNPHIQEKQFPKKHRIYHYTEDDTKVDHAQEGLRIFLSTQKERFLSMFGRKLQSLAKLFKREASHFNRYHYFGAQTPDDKDIYSKDAPLGNEKMATSYWLGHASCLLSIPVQTDQGNTVKINLITDPVEGDLNKLLYPRMTKLPLSLDAAQAPQVYLLSHNHLDHYSRATIKKLLKYQPIMMVPEGDGNKFKRLGFKNVYENSWWQTTEIPFKNSGETALFKITTVPSRHWSNQGPFDKHHSLFMGAIVHQKEGDIYFAGDTARLSEEHIATFRDRFNVRAQFQPGGPDEMRKDMESTHQASADGLWMHFNLILRALYEKGRFAEKTKAEFLKEAQNTRTIFMHTKTFKLGNLHFDDTDQSIDRVKKALQGNLADLREHERKVCEEIRMIAQNMPFKDGKTLETADLLFLLNESVLMPKIGSRTPLV